MTYMTNSGITNRRGRGFQISLPIAVETRHFLQVEEIISQACVDILPLSAEPISSWKVNGDLMAFLSEMYAPGGYSSYAHYLYKQELKKWKALLIQFQHEAD